MRRTKKKSTGAVLGLGLSAAVVAALLTPGAAANAAGNTLVVDAANSIRPVTHVGAGGLYAVASDTDPAPGLLTPLRLKQHTQPAPGVQQLGNGATVPSGDILKTAPAFTRDGAQAYARMPDVYPNFPYRWISWADWTQKIDTMVKARVDARSTTNINGWELWNEPDGTWDTAKAGPFLDGWTRTYRQVKSQDTTTPIVGPSYSRYYPDLMRDFMARAKADGTLPDVVVWHELDDGGWNDVDEHVADYRSIERSLGISPRPISINEYGSPNQVDTPSVSAHFIAQFERTGIKDAERAYWYESGTVGGLVWNDRPTGSYWLYKWYGEMAGNMVGVTPSGDLDGFASYDSTRKIVNVALGGTFGDNAVQVKGLASFGSQVRVTVNYTPRSGRMSNVAAPTQVSSTTATVVNGAVTVPITNQDHLGAYQVVVTPAPGPVTSYQQTYEAENATVVNASILPSASASNGSYVGRVDGLGDGRSNSFVDFVVEVPTAGSYSLTTRYANGGTTTSTQGLAYNGSDFSTVSYAPTGGWGQFATSAATPITLKAGFNVIRLAKGSPNFAGGTGFAELDSITVTPR
ncbi:CBM35 domain-containing protein [Frigoribacterium sp. VKM Ac-2530]|uniref:CBM35 domain-containing protein n=1 Tax=Frigoribacterium sp. VKM Ac-2530 TaxID=2783822 RepID=UPI001E2BA2AB|nr:CBM35 domain-containing protein [Frigoribacterium sp. VKM Ac-2530]